MDQSFNTFQKSIEINGTPGSDSIELVGITQAKINLESGDDKLIFKGIQLEPPDLNNSSLSLSTSSFQASGTAFSSGLETTSGTVSDTSAATIGILKKTDLYGSKASQILLGDGNNSIFSEGAFKATTIEAGDGSDTIKGYSTSLSGGFLDSTIQLGAGTNTVKAKYIQNTQVANKYSSNSKTLISGNGNDTVELNSSDSTPLMNAELLLGFGNNVISIVSDKTAVVNSSIKSDGGDDKLDFQGGDAETATVAESSINLGDGNNGININGNISFSDIVFGNGNDVVVSYSKNGSGGFNKTNISFGGGTDSLTTVYLNDSNVDTGEGFSTIDITNNKKITSIIKSIFNGGDSDDMIYASSFESTSISESKFELWGGADTIFAINQVKDSEINLGEGDNTLEVYSNPSTSLASLYGTKVISGSGNDKIILQNGINYSNINAGQGSDYIEIFQQKAGYTGISNSNLDLGSGNDGLFINADFISDGNSTVTGGEGYDTLILSGSLLSYKLAFNIKGNTVSINGQDFIGFEQAIFNDAVIDLTKSKNNITKAKSQPKATFKTTDAQIQSILSKLETTLSKPSLTIEAFDYAFSVSWNKLKNLGSIASEVFKYLDWSQLKTIDGWENTNIFSDAEKIAIKGSGKDSKSYADWKKISYNGKTFGIASQGELATKSDGTSTSQSIKASSNYSFSINGIEVSSLQEYSELDWSQVNIGDFSYQSLSEIDWSTVNIGNIQQKELKKLNWSAVNFGTFSAETYAALDWTLVDENSITKEQYKLIDWKLVELNKKKNTSLAGQKEAFEQKLVNAELNSTNWANVNFSSLTVSSKKSLDWSNISLEGSGGANTLTMSQTDLYQQFINNKSKISDQTFDWKSISVSEFSKSTYQLTDWSKVKLSEIAPVELNKLDWSLIKAQNIQKDELKKLNWSAVDSKLFSPETYAQLDWSAVKVGEFSAQSKKSLNWGSINFGPSGVTLESLGISDLFQYKAANGQAKIDYKKINLNSFSFEEFASTSYKAINWSKVNYKGIKSETYSQIDFSEVIASGYLVSSSYSKVNWSKVDFGDFKPETYQKTDWSKINFKGLSSSSYSSMDWSQVIGTNGFTAATYAKVDWSKVDYGDFKAQTYQQTNWNSVNFKGLSSSSYSSMDWSQVIGSGGFKAATYKKVDWNKVDFGDFKAQTFASTNWNLVSFKGMSQTQLNKIDWDEVNVGSLSKSTFKSIAWNKIDDASLDQDTIGSIQTQASKYKSTVSFAQKPPGALSFLGLNNGSYSTTPSPLNASKPVSVLTAATPADSSTATWMNAMGVSKGMA